MSLSRSIKLVDQRSGKGKAQDQESRRHQQQTKGVAARAEGIGIEAKEGNVCIEHAGSDTQAGLIRRVRVHSTHRVLDRTAPQNILPLSSLADADANAVYSDFYAEILQHVASAAPPSSPSLSSSLSSPCPFLLTYVDDEGETIAVTTGKELREADSASSPDKPLRLVVIDAPGGSGPGLTTTTTTTTSRKDSDSHTRERLRLSSLTRRRAGGAQRPSELEDLAGWRGRVYTHRKPCSYMHVY